MPPLSSYHHIVLCLRNEKIGWNRGSIITYMIMRSDVGVCWIWLIYHNLGNCRLLLSRHSCSLILLASWTVARTKKRKPFLNPRLNHIQDDTFIILKFTLSNMIMIGNMTLMGYDYYDTWLKGKKERWEYIGRYINIYFLIKMKVVSWMIWYDKIMMIG